MNSRGKNKGVISTLRIAGTMYENVGCAIQPKETLLALIQYSQKTNIVCVLYIFFSKIFVSPPPLPPPK